MNTNREPALDDLYYEVAMIEPSARVDFLDQLVRTHPEHARELTDFAVELAFDDLKHKETITHVAADSDPIVMRAMSKLQNRLYELDNEPKALLDPSRHQLQGRPNKEKAPVNPFGSLTHVEIRTVAKKLNANTLLVAKLRDRHIRPDTISPGFRQHTAEVLGVPEPVVTAHFAAAPEIRPDGLFKSDHKPEAIKQESFKDAVASCGLTEEQQRYLLSL